MILCLFDGFTGILLGHGASLMLAALLYRRTIPSVPATAAAFTVAAGVGIAFGFYPVWKASWMDPIEALRYE